jgi:hypothetical protein
MQQIFALFIDALNAVQWISSLPSIGTVCALTALKTGAMIWDPPKFIDKKRQTLPAFCISAEESVDSG